MADHTVSRPSKAEKPFIGSREEARIAGAVRYIDGTSCRRSHSPTIRLTSNTQCVDCRDLKHAEIKTIDPKSKNAGFIDGLIIRGLPVFSGTVSNARKVGATYYVNPRRPCPKGCDPSIRLVSNQNCLQCNWDWYAENVEHVAAYKKQRLADDPLMYSRQNKRRYAANPDYFKMRAVVWNIENREHKRDTDLIWKEENREHLAAYWAWWARTHPENMAAKHHKRRARKLGSTEHFTAQDVTRITEAQGRACAYCWAPIVPRTRAMDHFIPLARDGSNGPHNIVATCRPCNSRKSSRHPTQFIGAERSLLLKSREKHGCPERTTPLLPLLELIDNLLLNTEWSRPLPNNPHPVSSPHPPSQMIRLRQLFDMPTIPKQQSQAVIRMDRHVAISRCDVPM